VNSGVGHTLGGFFSQALLLAIATTRTAAAFTLLPIMTPDLVPPLVRNSLFIGFSLVVLAMQPAVLSLKLDQLQWISLFFREGAIGLIIGFLFGTVLWAFQSAGQIIDAKAGTTMAQVVDPLSGETTALNGAFLGRLANFVFMFSGGLLMLVTLLLQSYAIWPLAASAPHFQLHGVGLFETEFSRLMGLALTFAAPALVILTVVEAGMGLMNRFAPQLNVFSMSLSVKAWLSTLIVLATSGLLVQALLDEVFTRSGTVMEVLRALARP
jgi:type III secretion protein T